MAFVSEIEFMGLGMSLAAPPKWRNRSDERNVETFVTYYGACPSVCESIWSDLRTAADPSLRVGEKDFPLHLLLGLRYLKAYPKDDELCGFFRINSQETMRKWRNIYVRKLACLLSYKVRQGELSSTLLVLPPSLCSLSWLHHW
jgi:hypothetical protein